MKKEKKHSKYYYDFERNMDITMSVPEGMEFNTPYSINDPRIPDYYIGNNGYEARRVVSGFDLSYNIGTAVTYLLRAEKKHDTPIECIKKAIAHLEFELERLNNEGREN